MPCIACITWEKQKVHGVHHKQTPYNMNNTCHVLHVLHGNSRKFTVHHKQTADNMNNTWEKQKVHGVHQCQPEARLLVRAWRQH